MLLGRITGTARGELAPGIVEDLADLVDLVDLSPTVRAVVLAGTHPDRFLVEESRPRSAAQLLLFHDTLLRMNGSDAVFVAALNGSALGAGCELALACDARVMAEGPYGFGLAGRPIGCLPGGGGTQRLPRLIGAHRALAHILLGAPMTPAEAMSSGAVDAVVPSGDDVLAAAIDLAGRYCSRDRATVGAAKRCVWFGSSMELEDGLAMERAELLQDLRTPRGQHHRVAPEARHRGPR